MPPAGRPLLALIRSPSFTPPLREAPALFDLLGGAGAADGGGAADDVAREAERALLRIGPRVLGPAMERMRTADPRLRGRLCRLVGRFAPEHAEARDFLLACLEDRAEDPKVRRNAIIALGQVRSPEVEAALVRAYHDADRPEHRRSLAAALGRIGGEPALSLLRGVQTDDPELRRIADRAQLMLERTRSRDEDAVLRLDRALPAQEAVRLRCRPGLEEVLLDECRAVLPAVVQAPRVRGPGVVGAELLGPAAELLRLRTLLSFGWPLPARQTPMGDGGATTSPLIDLYAEAITAALSGPEAGRVFSTFSNGPVRFRLRFADGGHHRGLAWRTARLIAERCPGLRNDPTASPWEVAVELRGGGPGDGPPAVRLEICPRRYEDPRFAYRQTDVPAASHPTVAAALCRIGGVRADDVVWDPFVGSGLELCERALLGPYASLCGTDVDAGALAAAARNLDGAGVPVGRRVLQEADARTYTPAPRPTLILSNPPMGRRVLRGEDLAGLLVTLCRRAAGLLVPGGRMVWVSPLPGRTLAEARAAGLRPGLRLDVDMGGFTAQVQVYERPA